MRLFVALDIDDSIRQRLSAYIAGLKQLAPNARWVPPESLHVTLKFIGEFPEPRLDELKRALTNVGGHPFELTLPHVGFFTPRSPRVFWAGIEAGIEAGYELKALATSIDSATSQLGVPQEDRDFTPHLTLARTGSGRPQGARSDRHKPEMFELKVRVEAMSPPDFGTMTAREFFLYHSKTSPQGAVYTKLQRFPLG
ncbi:MAG: RNA 2',3'-cyclic phosphodiesterase [Acidobacteriota bacterium]|nr:RNA 2',3'-cyclic phosphodiesterase [Acidobacteriota bacterium]